MFSYQSFRFSGENEDTLIELPVTDKLQEDDIKTTFVIFRADKEIYVLADQRDGSLPMISVGTTEIPERVPPSNPESEQGYKY